MKPTYLQGDYTISAAFNHQSRLVLGTAGIGGVWGNVNETESVETLLYALENDVSVLDASPSYANAELYVGKALKEWRGKKPYISTKIGRLRSEDAFETKLDYSPEGMKRGLHHSLEVLGVDKIDLLFLHEPHLVPIDKIEEILVTLKAFKQQGLVKSLGVGGNPTQAFMPFISKDNFEVVSGFLRMNAANLDVFKGEIQHYKKNGIKYYAASPLHFGLLGDKFEEYIKEGVNGNWITAQDIQNAIKIKDLADRNNMPLASLCQRHLFSIEEADRVVIGAANMSQIQTSIFDWNSGKLPESLFNDITNIILR